MVLNWKKGFNPEKIIEDIEKSRKLDSSGKVSFQGWEQRSNFLLIKEMLDFPLEIIDRDKTEIVHKTIFELGTKGSLNKADILKEVRKKVRNFIEREKKEYVLFSTISIKKK